MLFPTVDFAVFFGVVFYGCWLLHRSTRSWRLFVTAASYVFYGWWSWRFLPLLAGVTLVAYLGGRALAMVADLTRRRLLLAATLVTELGLLGYFKYAGFLTLSASVALRSLHLPDPVPLLNVTLPVGISFFTFMAVSYLIDIFRRQLQPATLLDTACYLAFFPHLVAGPIVRGEELLPQLRATRDPRRLELSRAAWLIMLGLAKKVVLSSYLSSKVVDPVFGLPGQHSAPEILFAIYGYAVQIYADFSGYTDIAIGVALLIGIRLPQNFDAPYTARTLQDFWKRWHITLSRWLRDYLYIPLGGSAGSLRRTCVNIMITMVLGGLWHGAAWTFVAWGALHGVGQVAGHLRRSRRVRQGKSAMAEGPVRRVIQQVITFHLVCLGWVFFRADSFGTAVTLLKRLFTAAGPAPLVTPLAVLAIGVGVGAQYLPADLASRVQNGFSALRPLAQGAVLGVVMLVITTLGPQGVAPFIYFRF